MINKIFFFNHWFFFTIQQCVKSSHFHPDVYSPQYDVTIYRDTWGVPHIFGQTDRDAAYGLAYAHSEDDFKNIQDALLAARGKLASI